MNAKQAKRLRKYVRTRLGMTSATPLYNTVRNGQVVLVDLCQRYHYQHIKRAVKKRGQQ